MPLSDLLGRKVRVALGIDEAGINDDRDMALEMRLALHLHREPGIHRRRPAAGDIFRMATEGGALTTAFGERIGRIEVGSAADLVLLDWRQVSYPYLDPNLGILDALIRRSGHGAVHTVVVAGEVVYRDRRFTRVDADEVLRWLHSSLADRPNDRERRRRSIASQLMPHVSAFYEGWPSPGGDPFYKVNSKD